MGQTLGERLTLAGRILVLLTLFLAVGGPIGYFAITWEELPAGRYPIWFFVLPVLAGAALFYVIGAVVLRWLGIAVWREGH